MKRSSSNDKDEEERRKSVVDEYATFFEVVTHQILFLRGLYPDAIYERRRKYDTIVHMSRHPALNVYIHETFERIKTLLLDGSVKKIIVSFKDKKEMPIENYILLFHTNSNRCDVDYHVNDSSSRNCSLHFPSQLPGYEDLHNAFRSVLLKIMMQKPQQKLSTKCSFQIYIHCKVTEEVRPTLSSSASSSFYELINKGDFLTVEASDSSILMNCSEVEEPIGEHLKTLLKGTEYHMEIFHQSKRERNY